MMRPGVLIAVVVSTLGAAAHADGQMLPDNPLRGRLLFEEKQCNQCHGIAHTGPGVAPDLGAGHFRGSFLDLGSALWNHMPGMTVTFEVAKLPWPQLSEAETTELTAFLYFIDYLGRPGVAADGQRLFNSKGCVSCHSIGGLGATVGPDLTELRRFASPLFIAQSIWNHGPSMFESMRERRMAPPTLDEGDLADLSAFLRQRARPGPQERVLLAPGNPNEGQVLFTAKGCSNCHGGDSLTGDDAPDLSESDLHRSAEAIAGSMWNHAEVMDLTMRELGIGWPEFTTPELADLVAYLYFLPFADAAGNPERGSVVFDQKSCSSCHSGEGDSAHAGPTLDGSGGAISSPALVAALWNHAPVVKTAILSEGRPWPMLTGQDLRDILAYLQSQTEGS